MATIACPIEQTIKLRVSYPPAFWLRMKATVLVLTVASWICPVDVDVVASND